MYFIKWEVKFMTYSKFKDIIKIINEDSPIRNMGNTNLGFKEKCENDLRDLKKIESEMDIIYNKINYVHFRFYFFQIS